jgi:5'-deoxynucleotidase YfbR-like HD superfamily hydrolase
MELNIREMLVGNPIRLRYVFRFSTSRVQHPESVAEHSYYVCFYCLMIGKWCRSNGVDIRLEKLLQRAIVHDLEESRSGDFPRPFKHSEEYLTKALERASGIAYEQVLEPLVGKCGAMDELTVSWKESKDESPEGRVLEFADFLAVLSFMHEELGAGGNHSIHNHVKDMGSYFAKFNDDSYDFIRPLVEQAAAIMDGVFPAASGYASTRKKKV